MDGIMDGVLYERRRADRAEEQLAALREENARLRAEKERLYNVENEAAYSRAAIEELRKRSEWLDVWLDVWFQNAFPDWQTAIPPEGIPLRHFLLDRLVHERFEAREENARLRAVLDRLLTTFIGIGSDGEQLTPEAYGPALADALDFARAALAPEVKPEGSACADRAETVEQTHARWSAQPEEVKPEIVVDLTCGDDRWGKAEVRVPIPAPEVKP